MEDGWQGIRLLRGLYSASLTPNLNLVEIPDDSVPSAWAPEIAAISSRAIQQKTNYRLSPIRFRGSGGAALLVRQPAMMVDHRRLCPLLRSALRGERRRSHRIRGKLPKIWP